MVEVSSFYRTLRVFVFLWSLLAIAPSVCGQDRLKVSLGGPYGGDVRSLAAHPEQPDTFFLGTADGQVFVSEDSGGTWTKLVPGLNQRNIVIDNLAFDPTDPATLYAAAWELKSDGGWLFRSQDGGKTWEDIPLGRYHSAVRAIAVAPSNPQVIALGIAEGVILTTDRGKRWDRITRGYRSLHNVESLAFDPIDENTLYVGTWRLGWKTTNQGKSWDAIHEGMIFDSDMFSLVVDPTDPTTLYSSACTGVYKSQNSGVSWTKLKNGLTWEARRTRDLKIDPSDHNTIYAGTTLGLFVSTDAGASWRELVPDIVVNSIAVHPENSRIILLGTDDAGVLKSEDAGSTFVAANTGFTHRQIPALRSAPKHRKTHYASVSSDGNHGGFFVLTDGGNRWQVHNQGLGDQADDIRAILPSELSPRVYAGTPAGLYVSVPMEDDWSVVKGTRDLAVADLTFADGDEDGVFLATQKGVHHVDFKKSALKALPIAVYKGKVDAILYDQSSRQLFAGSDIGVFRSDDQGQTWEIKVKGLPYSPINVLGQSGQRLFCGTRAGLFVSDDKGETWSKCDGVYPIDIAALRVNPENENKIFAADFLVGHLFYSGDGGNQWRVVDLGFNSSRISALDFGASGTLLAGTVSEGVYVIEPSTWSAAEGR